MDGQALLGSFRSHDENCSDRIQYDSESSGLARDQKIKRDAPSLEARILDSSTFIVAVFIAVIIVLVTK
jgi:hypothetical protein